jgi:hypothetical protein
MEATSRNSPGISLQEASLKLEYLDVTVLRRGVEEVRVVAGRAPACRQVWRGMQRKEECFYN